MKEIRNEDIRKNTDERDAGKTLVEGVFGPTPLHWVALTFSIILVIIPVVFIAIFIASVFEDGITGPEMGFVLPIWILILLVFCIPLVMSILSIVRVKRGTLKVQERLISGRCVISLGWRTFSYRLDQIDGVEIRRFLGADEIVFNISAGHLNAPTPSLGSGFSRSFGAGVGTIPFLKNAKEVYDVISDLLLDKRTDKDVAVDIEMRKVSAQNRQADAVERIADNTVVAAGGSVSYIEELKGLKELLDSGVITQEEFDAKKAAILGSSDSEENS